MMQEENDNGPNLLSPEEQLAKTCAELERVSAQEDESTEYLKALLESEDNAKARLAEAEQEVKAARKEYDETHAVRLHERDKRSNARIVKHLLTINKLCLEFRIKLETLTDKADIDALCLEQVADRDGVFASLHDALLRDVTPIFPAAMVRITKCYLVWWYWDKILVHLGEDFDGDEMISSLDRYLHFWCETRVPPRPWEDVKFRQAVDAEWAVFRKAMSAFRAHLRMRGSCLSQAVETPQDRPASEAFVEKKIEGLKRHVTKRTRGHKKGTKPGPRRTAVHIQDLERVHAYVKDGLSLNKACDVVAAENADLSDSAAHYASSGTMRGEYPKWLEMMRKAGRRV